MITRVSDARALLQGLPVPVSVRPYGYDGGHLVSEFGGYDGEIVGTRDWEPGDSFADLDIVGMAVEQKPIVFMRRWLESLTAVAVIDATPSMYDGAELAFDSKYHYGCALAAACGLHVLGTGDNRFGAVFDGHFVRPNTGDMTALHVWEQALQQKPSQKCLAETIEDGYRLLTEPGLVIVISDFLGDEPWEEGLKLLSSRGNDVWCIRITAPLEHILPEGVEINVRNPETGQTEVYDTSGWGGRKRAARYADDARARHARVARTIRGSDAKLLDLRTDQDWFDPLYEFIRQLGSELARSERRSA